MSRNILPEEHIHPAIRATVGNSHADIVAEAKAAIASNRVVVIGMAQNPFCKKACDTLSDANIPYAYLKYGSYLSQWHRRNALKMWTGWPTFPMIFIKGTFIGGASDLQRLGANGELARMLVD